MNVGFFSKNVISNPKQLYGRVEILKHLEILANRKSSVSIIGLRRFGKTSILLSLEFLLKNNFDSKVYPVFFDFKEVGSIIKGTENVYRFMVSKLTVSLFQDKIFTEKLTFRKKTITPSSDWIDVFEDLSDVNPVRIQSLFEDLVLFFSEYTSKTILFLFDEYEYLFKYSFDNPVGFMKLRNFSSNTNESGINPFSFFIAGSISWNNLCTITGSPEMNCIDETRYLPPIEKNYFREMWSQECYQIESCPSEISDGWPFGFESSGGVPFFGKLIGSHWLTNRVKPNYFILNSYFQEILSSMQIEEKEILLELAKSPQAFKESKFIKELLEKGIIIKKGPLYEIKLCFLKDYIKAVFLDASTTRSDLPESYLLTDRISKLIITINNTNQVKKGYYIFELVNDESALLADLRTECTSNEQFSDFASSLYKIIFERTKQQSGGVEVTLKRLPSPFKRGYQFIDVVDIMRHSLGGGHLMGTFKQRTGQLSKTDMLQILTGSKNEPNSKEEFYQLQLNVLKLFEIELKKLNAIIRALK